MRKNKLKKTSPSKTQKSARQLVLHPNPEAVRLEFIKKYKAQLKSHSTRAEKIKKFEEIECNAYLVWFNSQFEKEQKALDGLRQQAAELEVLVQATQDYREMKRCSLKIAFQEVSDAIANDRLLEMMDAAKKEYNEKNPQENFAGSEEDNDDEFSDFFNSFFGGQDEDENPFEHRRSSDERRELLEEPKRGREGAAHNYAKGLYLSMVSKLHPDSNTALSTNHQELWHELQRAYKMLDIAKLESLLKIVTGQKPVGFDLKVISIGEIVGMTFDLLKKNRVLSRHAARLRSNPAWGFLKIKNNQRLLRATRDRILREMRSCEYECMMHINHLQHMVNSWSQTRKSKPRSRSRFHTSAY